MIHGAAKKGTNPKVHRLKKKPYHEVIYAQVNQYAAS